MKNIYLLLLLVISPGAINANILNKMSNIILGSEIWNLDSPFIINESSSIDRLGEAVSHGDYNGDGIQDLAIGIPNYDLNFLGTIFNNTGAVLIIYGSSNGLSSVNHQFLFQTLDIGQPTLESINGIEQNDFFGKSLASADFNCDGITDLAVGSPEENFNTVNPAIIQNVGAINIFYGSDGGFELGAVDGAVSTFLFQGTGLPNSGIFSSENDRFGWSMATGDFNGDGCYDLAVSAPFEDFGNPTPTIIDGGQVEVYYGRAQGLTGEQQFRDSLSQQSDDLPETAAETNDQFGLSLTAGDYSLSGIGSNNFDFLVVGIPGEDINNINNAGAVQVFEGGSNGIDIQNTSEIWSQAGTILGIVEEHDRFGTSLATGDFNADFADDLVIGVPRENLNNLGINDAGSVNIIYGGTFGLTDIDNQSFHQNTTGISGVAENSDRFGDVLTVGDLNGDSIDDLVIGVPREDNSRGAFHILYGSFGVSGGITTDDSLFERNLGDGEALDEMGYAMTVADFGNGNELAVGIPGDDSSDGDNDAGSVEVFSFIPIVLPDLIFANSFEE